ncbi:MAG TPA: hypothetical protein VIH96_07480, partial [Paraburkholderia sp.]
LDAGVRGRREHGSNERGRGGERAQVLQVRKSRLHPLGLQAKSEAGSDVVVMLNLSDFSSGAAAAARRYSS